MNPILAQRNKSVCSQYRVHLLLIISRIHVKQDILPQGGCALLGSLGLCAPQSVSPAYFHWHEMRVTPGQSSYHLLHLPLQFLLHFKHGIIQLASIW